MNLRKEAKNRAMSQKASDLKPLLDRIRDEKDLNVKKNLAITMAESFTVGGKEKFIDSVKAVRTATELDQLCYYAALKGEGLSSKLY